MDLKDYIESGKNSLKFVVSGKMGVGKSSLINGLIGKKLAKEAQSPLTVTAEITGYELPIEATDKSIDKTVDVVIMDCPGLGDPVNDEEANLTEIAKHCKDADLLIYCLNMRERMTSADTIGMKEFTKRVGPDVWKNAMFVLTFANEAVPSTPKPRGWLETVSFGYLGSSDDPERKEKFKSLLAEWEEAIPKFLRDKVKLSEKLTSEISIVPAGYRNLPPPDRTDWFSEFWFAALSQVKDDARPALVGINLHRFQVTSPDDKKSKQRNVDNDELQINIPVTAGKATGALAIGTTGGVALGALIGAAVGAVGGPAGLAVGLYAGALAGAGFGAAGGGTAGVAAGLAVIISAVQKHASKAKNVVSEKLR